MDLDEAAAELYAGSPDDFTARRTVLSRQARQDGDAAAAKEIGRLRRPTVSAWCLNRLAGGQDGVDDVLADLFDVAEALRRAQAELDAPRMTELSARRRSLVHGVQQRATTVARESGQALSAAALREVEETMAAVVASEEAAAAVASGRLTRALSYAGFGDVDLSDATATSLRAVPSRAAAPKQPAAKEGTRKPPTEPPTEEPQAARKAPGLRLVPPPAPTKAELEAAAAQQQVDSAGASLQDAEAALITARERAEALTDAVTALQQQLSQARSDAAAQTRALTTAERRQASAAVTLGNAERRLRAATTKARRT